MEASESKEVEPGEHAEHGGDDNPMAHILDKGLVGVDARTGKIVWKPYGEHNAAIAGYAPKMIGPVPLEFTKHMTDVTVTAIIFFVLALWVARRAGWVAKRSS